MVGVVGNIGNTTRLRPWWPNSRIPPLPKCKAPARNETRVIRVVAYDQIRVSLPKIRFATWLLFS